MVPFKAMQGETMDARTTSDKELTVFFDGGCPVCRREIGFYQRRRGADRISWSDVSKTDGVSLPPGLNQKSALARFHVQTRDGELIDGGDAFRAVWRTLPAFRPLGLVLGLPGLRTLLNVAYDRFLLYRPRLQRLVSPRCSA